MYTALSGKSAIFKQMQVIANNLANMNTAGFRAEKVLFEKALTKEQVLNRPLSNELADPNGFKSNEFVAIKGSYADLTPGAVQKTGNPLDVAIADEGLFVIQTADGLRYTRDGQFQTNAAGNLVTMSGDSVLGTGGAIQIGPGSVRIDDRGNVLQNDQVIGQLRLVKIQAEDLKRDRSQMFEAVAGANIQEISDPGFVSGAIEASNVNAVKEISDMIFAARMFEALEKVNESSGKMSQARNQVFGRGAS